MATPERAKLAPSTERNVLGGGVKNGTVSVCVCVCVSVYNFFVRTTGHILKSDSSFDRKCPREKTFTIFDVDFFRKSKKKFQKISFFAFFSSFVSKHSNSFSPL